MEIDLPKDAEGCEIPLDTKVLYDNYGFKNIVTSFIYFTNTGTWRVKFTDSTSYFAVNDMHLSEPDSWEKLYEDLERVADNVTVAVLDGPACIYANNSEQACGACTFYGGTSCIGKMCADIASRIRKLRGEG